MKEATNPSGLAMYIQLEEAAEKQLEFFVYEQDYHLLPRSVFPAGILTVRQYSQYKKEKTTRQQKPPHPQKPRAVVPGC